MAIKVKAVERLLKFNKDDAGEYRYVMQPELYISLKEQKVIREAALRSGVSRGVMQACWDAAGEVIKAWATEGHSVALPGLGTMRFGLSAQAVADVNDVKTGLIKTRRIIFTPNSELKQELADTAIQITCYDRNGEVVRRVTSADDGTVDDGEGSGTEGGGTEGGSTEGGGTSGTKYKLTLTAEPEGCGTVTGAGEYSAGEKVTVSATAAQDYEFSDWSDGNTNATREVTVTEDMELTANFTHA